MTDNIDLIKTNAKMIEANVETLSKLLEMIELLQKKVNSLENEGMR